MAKHGTVSSTARTLHSGGDATIKVLSTLASTKALRSLNILVKSCEKVTKIGDLDAVFSAIQTYLDENDRGNGVQSIKAKRNQVSAISGLSETETETLASAIFILVSELSRVRSASWNQSSLIVELQEHKLHPVCVKRISEIVFPTPSPLHSSLQILSNCAEERLLNIQWRLDVIITSHLGKKIMEPLFLVSITTTVGRRIMEVPVQKFHKMRYEIANILQEMQNLSGRKIMS